MDPKIIHTRDHPDLNPPNILDNSQKLIRKKILMGSQGSNCPLPRANYFPESLLTIENIQFDLPFELSLFKIKCESFATETAIDESVIRPYISEKPICRPGF